MTNEAPVKVVTLKEFMTAIQAATEKGDVNEVIRLSGLLKTFQVAKEKAEQDAREKVLAEVTVEIQKAIEAAVKPIYEAGKLDKADGIWYTNDFGEKLTTCTVMRKTAKARTGGGGGGKKYDVSTTDLLTKHGAEEYKDGITFQAAWDADPDKNKRFAVREALLKKAGLK